MTVMHTKESGVRPYLRSIAATALSFSVLCGTLVFGVFDDGILYFDRDKIHSSLRVAGLSIISVTFAVFGVIAASAFDLAGRKNYREVGFRVLLARTIRSTDFALSIFLFPFLFLTVVRSIIASEDPFLGLLVSFETGFVIKSIAKGLSRDP